MNNTNKRTHEHTNTRSWAGSIPVHYLYTHGIAGEKFFRAIKDKGTLIASRCEKCGITYLPPRIYCERCFEELDNFTPAGTKGSVETFTICGSEIIAFVRIDKTDGGIIHKIEGVNPKDVKIGMRVEAVFAEPQKRTGNIKDILHFKPDRSY